jgi:hypothetical protein
LLCILMPAKAEQSKPKGDPSGRLPLQALRTHVAAPIFNVTENDQKTGIAMRMSSLGIHTQHLCHLCSVP